MLVNPVKVRGNSSIDSWESRSSTTVAPGDDTAEGSILADEGSAGITLAGVLAGLSGADHVVPVEVIAVGLGTV